MTSKESAELKKSLEQVKEVLPENKFDEEQARIFKEESDAMAEAIVKALNEGVLKNHPTS